MAEDDRVEQSEKVSEKEKPAEKTSENVAREATGSLGDLVKMTKDEMADQKNRDRMENPMRAKAASVMLGRPLIFDSTAKDGQVLVPGMEAKAKGMVARDAVVQEDASKAARKEAGGADSRSEQGREMKETPGGDPGKQFEQLLKNDVAPEQARSGEQGQAVDEKARPEGKLGV